MENKGIINFWPQKAKKSKNLIKIIGGLILASGFLSLALFNTNIQIYANDTNITNKALAYDDKTTHPDLTREIIIFYELSTGKKFTEEQKQLVIQGSIDEDRSPRYLNHFYDPVFERGLSTATPGVNGYLAKNWAQFSSYQTIKPTNIANLWGGTDPVISGSWWGDFSYEAAIKDYSKDKEKESYLALGHILHLIEDMTVPEHTRNDPHPGGNLSSFYENWTMKNSSGLTQDLGKRIFNQGRKPIFYGSLEEYFNNLATYTNSHFFSPRTINSETYQKPKIVFEDGTFVYGKDENNELYDLARIDKFSKDKKWINDDQILQEYWLRLSRQAVVNGAGVIQLFLTQAEAAKQVELAKQKVDAEQPKSSLISQIYNFFISPEDSKNTPDLVIISEPSAAQPKINSVAVKPRPAPIVPQKPATQPAVVNPALQLKGGVNPAPTPIPVPTPIPAPTPIPTPAPVPPAPVIYGGGGSTSLTTSGGNSSSQQTATTTESSNVQTFTAGDLVINEIMYDLEGSDTLNNKSREWIEIYNNSNHNITLTGGTNGWRFNNGSANHLLNESAALGSMAISAGGYAILAGDAMTFLADHPGFSGTVIDTGMASLNNTSTTLKISTPDKVVIDEVTYSSSWGANGNGKTLERKSAAGGSNDAANWGFSSVNGGTPGAVNNWFTATTTTPEIATTTLAIATSTPQLGLGTDVSATTTIATNTTWTLAGSPYRLFFDGQRRPRVAAGAVLTIAPGVRIIPQGGNYTAMEIQGTLSAIATSGAPIIFTSIKDGDGLASTTPQAGEWLNIAFNAGSQGNLDYVEFRYGGQGLERPLKEMVKIIGATININHSKFENSQAIALRLVDSNVMVENSIFTDNACGISVDSLVSPGSGTDGGCAGSSGYFPAVATTTPQIKNNQFIRNRLIAIEIRNGATPVIDSSVFTDNGYPIRIESSYPIITNSQIANSTSSPNILNGIAVSGRTHFSQNYTLKKDLPYILETDGPAFSPYIDSGATLTIEPGAIFKTGHTYAALNINGSLVASTTPDNPIVFTSLKDDTRGGDTNGDGSITSPQNNDWANIKFLTGSIGNFTNTIFSYGGYGYVAPPLPPPTELAIENFDNYSAGPLSGQGDWGSGNPSNEISVASTTTHDGANSVYLSSGGGGAYTYRVLPQPITENGTVSFWLYYNSLGNQGVSITDNNSRMVSNINYDVGNHNCSTSDGNCFRLNGVKTTIQTTINAWHRIEVEVDFSNQRAKIRQDGGAWSDWVTVSGFGATMGAKIERIRFDRGYGDIFYDTFTYLTPSAPANPALSNPALSIDSGATVVVQ